jgi:hypothetical protein
MAAYTALTRKTSAHTAFHGNFIAALYPTIFASSINVTLGFALIQNTYFSVQGQIITATCTLKTERQQVKTGH